MELTCPSCAARYHVPDDAIGDRGRRVSCSNCGHGWRASAAAAGRSAGAPEAATPEASAAGADRHLRHEDGGGRTAEIHALRPSDPSRMVQLAEIRGMLSDVQSDEGAAAAEAPAQRKAPVHIEFAHPPDAQGVAAAAAAGIARPRINARDVDEPDTSSEPLHQDPLRRRMAEHDARAMRERRERERLRSSMRHGGDSAARGRGAFWAGFLLVVLVAAAMLAAYLLRPEIIARVPESEPVLTEYALAIDEVRRVIADAYGQARAWVLDVVADAA